MKLFLLGSFNIQHNSLSLQSLKSDKNEALLGYLAITPNKGHRRSELAGLLWPNYPEADARHSLSQAVYTLRAFLETSPDGTWFQIQRHSIEWTGHETWVDCHAFDRLLQACRTHLHDDEMVCPACLANLEEANRLYRGEFWSGFSLDGCEAFEDWLRWMRQGYHQNMIWAIDRLVKGWSILGDLARALDYSGREMALDPYYEAGRLQYMRLLVESGRRLEAIASHEAYQRLLAEELNTEPGEEINQFYQKILHAQRALPARPATNLPGTLAPLVGRHTELDFIYSRLSENNGRLVTILGLGGAGKTRLAMEAGWRQLANFPDGVWVIQIGTLKSAEGLLPAIVEALGKDAFSSSGMMMTRRSIEENTLNYLRSQRLLLILDGFERIPEATAQVAELLRSANLLKILITSQIPLGLEGESLIHLDGLPYPPLQAPVTELEGYSAVRLYIQTVQRTVSGFALTKENSAAVAEICRMVQGMPLAIILAATWNDVLEPDHIAREIRHSLDFLTIHARSLPDRQQSLRATFDYSWRLLAEPERQACRRLSVFQGGFTPAIAAEVCQVTLHDLKVLLDQSLLQRDGSRFSMHDLVRMYAGEQLAAQPEEGLEINQRLSQVYLSAAEGWSERLRSREQLKALAEMDQELANLQLAWNWAADHQVPALEKGLDGFFRYYLYKGRLKEGLAACQRVLQTLVWQEDGARAQGIEVQIKIWQCRFLMHQEKGEEGRQLLEPVVRTLIEENRQDPAGLRRAAAACLALARVLVNGDSEAALELASRGLDIYHSLGQKQEILSAQNDLASIYAVQGNVRATYRVAQEALTNEDGAGDPYIRCQLSIHLLFDYLLFGEDASALKILRNITAYYDEIGGPFAAVELRAIQATTYFWVGQLETAQAFLEKNIADQIKMDWLVNHDFEELLLCQIMAANREYREAIDRCSRLMHRNEYYTAQCLALMATIYLALGNIEEAARCLEMDLSNITSLRRDFWAWPESLAGLLAYWQGELGKARSYLSQALEHAVAYPVFLICATTLGCLALILAENGRLKEGVDLFRRTCAHPFSRRWGPYHDFIGCRLPGAYEPGEADSPSTDIFRLAQVYLDRIQRGPDLVASLTESDG